MSDFDEPSRPIGIAGTTEMHEDLLLTPWSIVHFLSGAACKGLGWSFWANFALHGAYEAKDHLNKEENYNSTLNSAGDQFCSMFGFMFADKNIKWMYYWIIAYGIAVGLGSNIG